MPTRRQWLIAGGLIAGGAYSLSRGLRYPRLSLEPRPLATRFSLNKVPFEHHDCIALDRRELVFQAYAPQPVIKIGGSSKPIELSIGNMLNKATLQIDSEHRHLVRERQAGLKRSVSIKARDQAISLNWKLPADQSIRFAVIGDTGAGAELLPCLARAHELDADFLLHLGDFNYSAGEYDKAIQAFHNAPLPCYVTIGNHDFHHKGLIYHQFREQLGPMNNAFEIHGVRFVNLDTAADFFPASSGNRGALLKQLSGDPKPQIIFTHRPLKDPRPHDDHEIGGVNEIAYLTDAILASGGGTFLNGHVHHSAEFEYEGLRQYTVGEGLGHENLVLQKQVAKLLIGEVQPNGQHDFTWQPLNLPWRAHLSPTHEVKLKRDGRSRQLEWYRQLIANTKPV